MEIVAARRAEPTGAATGTTAVAPRFRYTAGAMIPPLAYERPIHVEDRFQPRSLRVGLLIGAGVLVVVGLTLVLVARRKLGWPAAAWMAAGPTIGLVVLTLCTALHARTVLFADRLEVSIHLAGVRAWRRRVPWPAVLRADVRRRQPGQFGFQVWGRGPGLTVVMSGGDGVSIYARDQAELLIGSSDADRLAAAINAARTPVAVSGP